MQSGISITLAATALLAACVPGSPIYIGPPVSTLTGHVYSAETALPLSKAEVCIFGADTVCVRATETGSYKFRVFAQVVSVRFRTRGHTPAMVEGVRLVNDSTVTVDCSLTNKMTLSDQPVACLPAPRR